MFFKKYWFFSKKYEKVENAIFSVIFVSDEEIKLPKTFTLIGDIKKLRNGKLKTFIEKRHITQEMIDTYHIGYTQWDNEEKNIRSRLIVPSYDNKGNLVKAHLNSFMYTETQEQYIDILYDESNPKNVVYYVNRK